MPRPLTTEDLRLLRACIEGANHPAALCHHFFDLGILRQVNVTTVTGQSRTFTVQYLMTACGKAALEKGWY